MTEHGVRGMDGVVFDMDGVLFDTERLSAIAWRRVGHALSLPDIEESLRACVGRNGSDTRAFLISRYGDSFNVELFFTEVRKAYQEIVEAVGLPVKPGAAELLKWLSSRGDPIALATSSGRGSTERNLQVSGLAHYFDAVVTGDMLAHGKPAPDIYLLACDKLGARPENCFAIEDSPNGVLSATAAGLKTILVPDVAEVPEDVAKLAFKTFASLIEVKAYFESL